MKYWSPEALKTRVPVYTWSQRLDDKTLRQLARIARQPYVVKQVAAMPDAHVANGVAVGTVFATHNVVVPSALGGDLGCGVAAVRFEGAASEIDTVMLRRILLALTRAIPTGDTTHRRATSVSPIFDGRLSTRSLEHACNRLYSKHLGTLGGGNHFLELDRDTNNGLWLMVHSGSRGLGGVIAEHHQKVAAVGGANALGGLRTDEKPGRSALSDCAVAFEFAKRNRTAMLEVAADIVTQATGKALSAQSAIDVHHDFVQLESHGGEELLVHRKGAIAAARGTTALIPGSMATASYLVQGLGEPLSFASASHGAGRVMSRREARERIRPKALERMMRRVVFDASKMESLVEESPAAYREVTEVLEDESDLVRPRLRLEPMLVLKG